MEQYRYVIVGTQGNKVFLSSEESATWRVCAAVEDIWIPVGDEPVVARLGQAPTGGETWQGSEVFAGAH